MNNKPDYLRWLKRILCGILMLTAPHIQSFAQVGMGARLGLNMSTITNTSLELGVKRQAVGPGGGFIVHIKLTDIFAIQPELLFNARGISASATIEDIHQRATKRLYYIDVPFMIRAYYSFNKIRIYGGMGPQISVGLFVQDVVKTSGEHFTNKFSETSSFSSRTRRYEMAWDFDAGIGIPVGNKSEIEINIRPMLGLINIAKEKFNEDSNRNFMVSFSVAYVFHRGQNNEE